MRKGLGLITWVAASLACGSAWAGSAGFAPDAGRQGFGGSGGSWESVTCESRDFRRAVCSKPSRGHATLVRQVSKVDCVEGRNWGQNRDSIWVDNGCAATFELRGGGPGGGFGGGPEAVCESKDFRYQTCNWRKGWGFPQLVEQISRERCVRDRNWGYDRRGHFIWVDRGCAARFRGQ